MCGIVASWRPRGQVSEEGLGAGTRALRHRGPDGQGTWIAPDRMVALGHTRLAITAPASGAQPVASEDGRIVAVVNGEIYGHRALRQVLGARGHTFRTESDSELLVHLYEDRGLKLLHDIDGELCFALWDGHARRLVAGRDRFGARTLVWRRTAAGLDLASEANALFAMGAPARWDGAAMAWAMAMQYVPADRTVFEGIAMLPPGSLLVADAGGVRVQRWAGPLWQPQAATSWPGGERGEDAAVEAFRRTFVAAVADRVDTEARFCFHLSGGIDSAAVLGAAAAVTGQTLDAFTVSFPGSPLDELAHATANAGHVGARLHPIALRPADLLAALEDAAAAGEGLAVNGHLSSHFLMDRAIQAAGFRVILSGEGADELLAGYPHLREDLAALAGQALPASDSSATRGLMLAHGDTLPVDGLRARLGFVPAFVRAKASIGAKLRALASADFLATASADPLAGLVDRDGGDGADGGDEPGALRALHPVDASLVLWTRLALGGYILPTLSDRLQGAHGLEGRLPFLDGRLLALVRGLPLAARIRDDQEKWLLRQAVHGLVPEATRLRRKHPFLAPAIGLGRDPGAQELVRHMLDDFRARTFFDPDAIARRMQALTGADPAEQTAWEPAMLLALTAHALGRAYALE